MQGAREIILSVMNDSAQAEATAAAADELSGQYSLVL